MSAFIREKKDFHAGVFTAQGKLIAGKAKPSASDLVTPIFGEFPPEQMKRGDIYWYNDCYAARGAISHGPDQCLIAPVFLGDTLVAFAQSWAHFTDIGGMLAGAAVRRLSGRLLADEVLREQADQYIQRYITLLLETARRDQEGYMTASLLGSDQGRAFLLLGVAALAVLVPQLGHEPQHLQQPRLGHRAGRGEFR